MIGALNYNSRPITFNWSGANNYYKKYVRIERLPLCQKL